MKDTLDEWFESVYNKPVANLREGTHYKDFNDLMAALDVPQKERKWKNRDGKELTQNYYDYPNDLFDIDVKPIRCLEKVEFDDADEEGTVECYTAAECEYHGRKIVVALPVTSYARYIQTSYTPATYWDPAESEGYYEISEDLEVGDSWSAIFSSEEVYNKFLKEYQQYRRQPRTEKKYHRLGDYLEANSDFSLVYTKDGDSFDEDILAYVDSDFYEKYLDVVDRGFETEVGDSDAIDKYHRYWQDIDDEIDRRREEGL